MAESIARAGVAAVMGLVVVVGSASPAAAQPDPTDQTCAAGEAPTSVLPDGCWGTFPTSNYDIGADPGETGDLATRMYGGTTAWTFNLGKGALQLGLWGVEWALASFDIRTYDGIPEGAAQGFHRHLLANSQLPFAELAWLVLLAWAGCAALRGRLSMAGTEIMISIALAGVSAMLMANQSASMDATWGLVDRLSTAVLVAGRGDDSAVDEGGPAEQAKLDAVAELQRGIHEAFVEVPYDYLSWGGPLGDAGDPDNPLRACAAARDGIVAAGPHGGSPRPRQEMSAAGPECADAASFNADASGARTMGALLTMVASATLALLLFFAGLTVVVAKVLTLLAFAVAPFAVLAAILPGYGRRLAWAWLAALIQLVSTVVVMSYLLSVLLLVTDVLIGATAGIPPLERFLLLDVVVFMLYRNRKNLLSGLQAFAASLGDFLAVVRGGQGATWRWRRGGRPIGARPGASDYEAANLLAIDTVVVGGAVGTLGATAVTQARAARRGKGDRPTATATHENPWQVLNHWELPNPLAVPVLSIVQRRRERRFARRSYRNLERQWRYSLRYAPYSTRTRYQIRPRGLGGRLVSHLPTPYPIYRTPYPRLHPRHHPRHVRPAMRRRYRYESAGYLRFARFRQGFYEMPLMRFARFRYTRFR